jgi:hypothetical protein
MRGPPEAQAQFQAGDPVQPSASATTVTVRDGRTTTSDGPASPGGEQIIGFYVLEVAGPEEAVALGAKIPPPPTGASRRGRSW